jgi:hypothetical protein
MAGNKVTITLTVDDKGTPVIKSFSGQAQSSLRKVETASDSAATRMSSSWGKAKAGLLAVTGAILAAKGAWDAAKFGAKAIQLEESFNRLAEAAGYSGDQMLDKMREVTEGMVSDFDLIQTASKAMVLGLDPKEIVAFLKIAKVASKATGDSVTKSFEDIATGVARQSKMILDNLGIIISLEKAYAAYAIVLNKSVGELTDLEKRQAFNNAVMEAGDEIVRKLGEDTETAVVAIAQMETAFSNAWNAAKKLFTAVELFLMGFLTFASGVFGAIVTGVAAFLDEALQMATRIPGIGKYLEDFSDRMHESAVRANKAMKETFEDSANYIRGFVSVLKNLMGGEEIVAKPTIEVKGLTPEEAEKQKAEARKLLLEQYKNNQEAYEAIRVHMQRVRELRAQATGDAVAQSEIQRDKERDVAHQKYVDLLNSHVQMKAAKALYDQEIETIEEAHQARLAAIKDAAREREAQKRQEETQHVYDHLDNFIALQQESLSRWQQSRFNAWATDLEQTSLAYQQELANLKAHSDNKIAIKKAEEEMNKAMLKEGARAVSQTLEDTLYYWSAHSKNVWRMYKAYAIARALVDTYQATIAAFRAMAGIPPAPLWGVLAGAAAFAWGMTRVQMIRQQERPAAAEGGIFTGPTSGFGATLHGTEAVVPLPNGRSIPVEAAGGGGLGGGNLQVNITATDAQSFTDLVARNPQAIMGPLVEQMQLGNRNLISTMQDTTREE